MKSSSAAVKVTDLVRGGTFRLKLAALKVVLFRLMLLYRVLVCSKKCEVWSATVLDFMKCKVWSANVKVRVCEARANRTLLSIASDDNLTFKLQVL